MSIFKKVFGKKEKNCVSLTDAIRNLKTTEELLTKKQKFYEEEIEKQLALAKKHASNNKKVALQALQKKKRLEGQLRKVDGALTTLEQQRDVLENASTNKLAVDSMKGTSGALAAAHKNVNVEQVDKLLDELSEQQGLTDDISNALCHSADEWDETELEKELEEISEELADVQIDSVLPSVPADHIKIEEKKKVKTMEAAK